MELFTALASSDELRLDGVLQPGDVQLLSNHVSALLAMTWDNTSRGASGESCLLPSALLYLRILPMRASGYCGDDNKATIFTTPKMLALWTRHLLSPCSQIYFEWSTGLVLATRFDTDSYYD